jgi:polyphosphate glucokinase
MHVLGVDIGGSGIKGAVVETTTGTLVSARRRVKTPRRSTPENIANEVAGIAEHLHWSGLIGCGMPGPLKDGLIMTANNIDKSWLGRKAEDVFSAACGRTVKVVNDADAAGMAEMQFGCGQELKGVVVFLTLGTGIGSALFIDGTLVPNTEFGQVEIRGKRGELRAAARLRKEKGLSWKAWGKRLDEYMHAVEALVWPDCFILGGGVSRNSDKFIHRITTRAQVKAAQLRNEAGIIGAALLASRTIAQDSRGLESEGNP